MLPPVLLSDKEVSFFLPGQHLNPGKHVVIVGESHYLVSSGKNCPKARSRNAVVEAIGEVLAASAKAEPANSVGFVMEGNWMTSYGHADLIPKDKIGTIISQQKPTGADICGVVTGVIDEVEKTPLKVNL